MGNNHLTDEEKEVLAKENIPLIYFVIKKMNLDFRREELYDVGLVGLARGLKHYDKSKGIKTSTFFSACIHHEIGQYLITENTLKRQAELVSLNAIVGDEGTELQDLIGYDPNYDEEVIKQEIMDKIDRRLSFLSEKWQDIFKDIYGLDGRAALSQTEVAKKHNVTQSHVSWVQLKIIRMLKFYLSEYTR